MSTTKKSWVAIIVMFGLFAMIGFVTNLCNPIAVIVKNQFGISNFQAQLGNFANFVAYLVMGIPSGWCLQKFGYKRTAMIAIILGIVGLLLEWAAGWESVQSFWVYITGAFIAGFCMCMLNTVVNPMLNTLGGGGNKGNQLIQFGGVLNSLSVTFVTIFAASLIGDVTKAQMSNAAPAIFIALGIFVFAMIVLCIVKIEEPELDECKLFDSSVLKYTHTVCGLVAIFLYMCVEVGLPTYILQYLSTPVDAEGAVGLGMDAGVAGTVAALYWLLMLVGRFCGGVVGGKVSSRTLVSTVATIAVILILAGIFAPATDVTCVGFESSTGKFALVEVPLCTVFFVLGGLCTSVMWGGIFNMAVEGLNPTQTKVASGLFMTMVFGGAILVPFQGYVADVTSSFLASYWVPAICAAYILIYALVLSRPKVAK